MATIVEIPNREQHEGYEGNIRRYDIGDTCLICGQPREITKIFRGLSYDGSRRLNVDCWTNKCGHVEKYSLCREKGKVVDYTTPTAYEIQEAASRTTYILYDSASEEFLHESELTAGEAEAANYELRNNNSDCRWLIKANVKNEIPD